MWLCIDCGNSRLKWGAHDNGRWLQQAALPLADLDRLTQAFSTLPRPTGAIACSVAGDEVRGAVQASVETLGVPLTWLTSQAAQCGVTNSYANPAQLGADRWAAMIGARHLFPGGCLVVNAGTATTIDVLDGAGVFQGGLILPGISLMQASLAGNTARLPLAAGECRPLPRNTADAIASGALLATAGAVARMFAHLAATPGATCLVTGGAAPLLLPVLQVPARAVEHLVLEGLLRVAADRG